MDVNPSPSRNGPLQQSPTSGGTVEPANRATVAKERFQTPIETSTQRYELRDPFAEVTYRATSFSDMATKADQLGSSRFVAIDEQGQRTTIQKKDGQWPEQALRVEPQTSTKTPMQPAPQPSPPSQRSATVTALREATPPPGAKRAGPGREATDALPSPLPALDAKAERDARVARLEAALAERYVVKRAPVKIGDVTIGRTEYRFRGDTTRIAFTESTFRLATDTNNPSVARSMIDVAQARNWHALRVSGNEDFKRLVWLEANARGVKTLGYEPSPADLELLKREREARLVNRIEPERTVTAQSPAAVADPASKASQRGSGGRKTVLAAIEAVLVAKGVPERQREAVMVAAAEKLEQRIRAGQAPKVKIYDPTVPSQRPAITPAPQKQRTLDRASPSR